MMIFKVCVKGFPEQANHQQRLLDRGNPEEKQG
jgi:hypothetical protein